MFWKSTGLPAYEKLDDNEVGWWSSLEPNETKKPLYKTNGELNRFGFKWTDNQVYEWYRNIMTFDQQGE